MQLRNLDEHTAEQILFHGYPLTADADRIVAGSSGISPNAMERLYRNTEYSNNEGYGNSRNHNYGMAYSDNAAGGMSYVANRDLSSDQRLNTVGVCPEATSHFVFQPEQQSSPAVAQSSPAAASEVRSELLQQ